MGKTNSQDQSASSESEFSMNVSQAEISQPIVQFPYAYGDPYFTGLFTAYGPHAMITPQVMGPASSRVPLPVEVPEDGPIYVNAKQYHGILRRRQIRAKLEAQNKLVKTRKPYLHESRHQHALNRVRGSGGRFLKKSQPSDSHPPTSSQNTPGSFHFNHNGNIMNLNEHLEANKQGTTPTAEGTRADPGLQQADSRFSSIPSHMAGPSGGFVYNGNRHYASIVR